MGNKHNIQNNIELNPLNGERLGQFLNRQIDSQSNNDEDERQQIIARMAREAGISESTVGQILRGDITCPPIDRLEGFSRALNITVERIIDAAEADGCQYENGQLIGCRITPAANAGNNNLEEKRVMTIEEFKALHLDIYTAAVNEGIEQEKDRVTAHITMGEAGNCQDLAVKNIKEGNTITATVQAEYMAEGMKNRDISNRNDDDGNLQNLGGGDDGSGDNVDGESEEEINAYEEALNNGTRGKKKAVKK